MDNAISHDRDDETLEAKARWFQSLTVEERMDYLCVITDLVYENNPTFEKPIDAESLTGRVRVLEQPRR